MVAQILRSKKEKENFLRECLDQIKKVAGDSLKKEPSKGNSTISLDPNNKLVLEVDIKDKGEQKWQQLHILNIILQEVEGSLLETNDNSELNLASVFDTANRRHKADGFLSRADYVIGNAEKSLKNWLTSKGYQVYKPVPLGAFYADKETVRKYQETKGTENIIKVGSVKDPISNPSKKALKTDPWILDTAEKKQKFLKKFEARVLALYKGLPKNNIEFAFAIQADANYASKIKGHNVSTIKGQLQGDKKVQFDKLKLVNDLYTAVLKDKGPVVDVKKLYELVKDGFENADDLIRTHRSKMGGVGKTATAKLFEDFKLLDKPVPKVRSKPVVEKRPKTAKVVKATKTPPWILDSSEKIRKFIIDFTAKIDDLAKDLPLKDLNEGFVSYSFQTEGYAKIQLHRSRLKETQPREQDILKKIEVMTDLYNQVVDKHKFLMRSAAEAVTIDLRSLYKPTVETDRLIRKHRNTGFWALGKTATASLFNDYGLLTKPSTTRNQNNGPTDYSKIKVPF